MKIFVSEESVLRHNKRNRPLPSSKNPHFQNEAKCTTFLVKMSLIWYRGLGELANGLLLRVLPGSLLKTATASPAMHEGSMLREIAEPCMEDSLNYLEKKG